MQHSALNGLCPSNASPLDSGYPTEKAVERTEEPEGIENTKAAGLNTAGLKPTEPAVACRRPAGVCTESSRGEGHAPLLLAQMLSPLANRKTSYKGVSLWRAATLKDRPMHSRG